MLQAHRGMCSCFWWEHTPRYVHIADVSYHLSECSCYSSCGTWWHTRRNHISSFPETDESIQISGGGRQFSRLLAAEVCSSALVMLDIPRSEVAWEYWLPTPFASFPFTSPPMRHRVPPGSERALRHCYILAKAVNTEFAIAEPNNVY